MKNVSRKDILLGFTPYILFLMLNYFQLVTFKPAFFLGCIVFAATLTKDWVSWTIFITSTIIDYWYYFIANNTGILISSKLDLMLPLVFSGIWIIVTIQIKKGPRDKLIRKIEDINIQNEHD